MARKISEKESMVGHINLVHRMDDKVDHVIGGNPIAEVGREKKPFVSVTGDKLFAHGPDYISILPYSMNKAR